MIIALFIILSAVAIGGALGMLLSRNPVHSALSLVTTFFSLAGMYLMLNAEFLAMVQIIVYAGAIMVLFLFVIMLLGITGEESLLDRLKRMRPAAILFSLILLVEILFVMQSRYVTGRHEGITPDVIADVGSVRIIGGWLYTKYLFPFEVTSILLLVAIVGAIYLGKRRI